VETGGGGGGSVSVCVCERERERGGSGDRCCRPWTRTFDLLCSFYTMMKIKLWITLQGQEKVPTILVASVAHSLLWGRCYHFITIPTPIYACCDLEIVAMVGGL